MVLLASGRTADRPYFSLISAFVSKMEGQGRDQSMISAADRQGRHLPDLTASLSLGACVGSGQQIGRPSHRAISTNRLRVVGAP